MCMMMRCVPWGRSGLPRSLPLPSSRSACPTMSCIWDFHVLRWWRRDLAKYPLRKDSEVAVLDSRQLGLESRRDAWVLDGWEK